MSVAAETRQAARERPFLLAGLRAGVVNYRAAAESLDVGGTEAVAAALRRYAEALPPPAPDDREARVTVQRGVRSVGAGGAGLFAVGDSGYDADGGPLTALLANGDVDTAALAHVLARLDAAGVAVEAAAVAGGTLALVVDSRDGARALQTVESALSAVPDRAPVSTV